jgi:hypothetical protein
MERMTHDQKRTNPATTTGEPAPRQRTLPAIFGLRYLEEEAAEIHDVVGCMSSVAGRTAESLSCTDDGDI